MQGTVVSWLDGVGSMAFTLSAWTFVLVNGLGLAVLAWKRDRDLVNRWTSRFLALNLMLLGTGVGVPLVTLAARTTIVTLSPAVELLALPAEDDAALAAEAASEIRRQ